MADLNREGVASSLGHLCILLSHPGCLPRGVCQVQLNNAIALLEQHGGLWGIKANKILVDSIAMEQDSQNAMDLDSEGVLLSR